MRLPILIFQWVGRFGFHETESDFMRLDCHVIRIS